MVFFLLEINLNYIEEIITSWAVRVFFKYSKNLETILTINQGARG